MLIGTHEYHNSMPGVMKNAIDWLSRPASDVTRMFRGRPVALMGATPGSGGTALSQAAWLPVDATTKARIRTFVEGFALFIEAQRCLD